MQLVPEAIVAAHCGIKVIGLVYICNYSTGIEKEQLSYDEVKEIALHTRETFKIVLKNIIAALE